LGIFTRRRTAVTGWQLAGHVAGVGGYLTCDGSLMEDDGCASDKAYGAVFERDDAPDATLAIWAYAAPRSGQPEQDGYMVGYRVDRIIDTGGDAEPWTDTVWCGDEAWCEWYADVSAAAVAAQHDAAMLALNGQWTGGIDISADAITEWFGWDGEPY
jgi:hypothetical protein